MIPEWDIVESLDVDAIKTIAERICGLPDDFGDIGGNAPGGEFAVTGRSFRARCFVLPDRPWGDQKSRVQLTVEFAARTGPWPKRRWSIWVRCDCPGRKDRVTWRGLRKGLRPECVLQRSNPSSWEKTGHLWVAPDRQARKSEDVAAQIALFLLQTVSRRSRGFDVREWLLSHLRETFRLTDTEAEQALHELRRYCCPPTRGSWGSYVRRCVAWTPDRIARRRTKSLEALTPKRKGRVNPRKDDSGLTVGDATHVLGLGKTTVYDMIQRHRIKVERTKGHGDHRYRISSTELSRVKSTIRPKPEATIALVQSRMHKSYAAARKWVWRERRRGLTLAAIRDRVANRPRLVKKRR